MRVAAGDAEETYVDQAKSEAGRKGAKARNERTSAQRRTEIAKARSLRALA